MVNGKNIVITGAKGDIGKEICRSLAEKGVNIWACIRKPDAEAESYFEMLAEKNNVWIKTIYMELGNDESMKKGIGKILDDKLPIDVIINNAGELSLGMFNLISIDEIRRIYQVNYFSQLYIIQRIIKRMMRNKKGNIINIASTAGLKNEPGRLAYGGSKAAIIYMTKTLANEYKPFGIRVNAIAPGITETKMLKNVSPEIIDQLKNSTYDKRLGTVEDIAHLVCFLASDASSHINGEIIRIDGGA